MSGRFPDLEKALCERIRELRADDPLLSLTIVVGSSLVRRHLGDRLVRAHGAIANVSLVTLARLATRLAAGPVGAPPVVFTDIARERLLRRHVVEAKGLRYFGPVGERPHFAQALAATFSDLRQALVDPTAAWARLVPGALGDPSSAAGRKAIDLGTLYGAYCADLAARGFADDAAVYAKATAAAESFDTAAGRIALYGLYDLNPAQEALVAALLAAGADLFVPLPRAAEPERALILTTAVRAGRDPETLAPPAAAADRDRVAAVWRSPQLAASPPRFAGDGTLTVVSVPDERSEASEAARAVLAAVSGGTPLWDCAVVIPQRDDVERVAAGLQAAGLPPACRLPDRSEGTRVLLRLLECLAPAAGEPFSRRAVLDLFAAAALRTGAASPREAALWLDEARRAGVIAGLHQWVERVGRRRRGLEARLAEIEAADEAASAAVEDDEGNERLATKRLRLEAVRGLEAAVGALQRACGGLAERAGWGEWALALGAVAEELFVPATAAAVLDAAGRLQALDLLGESVDVAEMSAVLREQLGAARVPVGRVGRHGVAVLTPLEMRGLAFATVVFTGLAEGGFPARGRPDPVIGDAERRGIGESLGVRLPLAEDRVQESLLLFAFACEAARERLVLIGPRTDAATGRPRLPSRLLLRLASMAAGHPVGLDEYLSGAPLRPVWRHVAGLPEYSANGDTVWLDVREHDTAALLAIGDSQTRSGAHDYLGAVLAAADDAERRMGVWRAARSPVPGPWDGLLGEEARDALLARHPFHAEMHPTRLERYVDCPFAFYLQDVLGLQAPEEPVDALEMEARELGILAHWILQQAFEQLVAEWDRRSDGPDLAGALTAVTAAWQAGCKQAERRGVTGAALAWEVRRATLLEDLLEVVRRDPVFAGDGRPLSVEWRFGEAAGRPVALELPDGRRIRFAGRLDRVDSTATGTRVIDYKTGRGATEQERLRHGLSAQLPVYRMAVRQAGDRTGEIACLYRLVTRRGGFADVVLPDDEATSSAHLRALVVEVMKLVGAGIFPRSTQARCDFCDLKYACGVSSWARTRKREHDLLRDVVRLQRSGTEEVVGGV